MIKERNLLGRFLGNSPIKIKCKICKKEFESYLSQQRIFCSKKCWSIQLSIDKLGCKLPKSTKKKIGDSHRGNKSYLWKEKDIGYNGIHSWLLRNYGNPLFCEDCGIIGRKLKGKWNIEWSDVNHKYRRIFEDYCGRCTKCHAKYDILNNLSKKGRKIKIK